MPYKVPDGFMELSRMRNRAAVHRAAAERTKHKRSTGVRWAMSIAATAACLAIGIVGYQQFDSRNDELTRFIAQIQYAPDDMMDEMAADAVEYPEDINLL